MGFLDSLFERDSRKFIKRKDSDAGEAGRALEEIRGSLYNELRTSDGAKRQQQRYCGPVVAMTFNFMVAVGIIMANKLVMGRVGFNFPIFLTLIHYTIAWFLLAIFKAVSLLPVSPPTKTTPFSSLFSLGVVMAFASGLANTSLKHNSVGFYQMAKIAVTPTIVFSEFILFKKTISFKKVPTKHGNICLKRVSYFSSEKYLGVSRAAPIFIHCFVRDESGMHKDKCILECIKVLLLLFFIQSHVCAGIGFVCCLRWRGDCNCNRFRVQPIRRIGCNCLDNPKCHKQNSVVESATTSELDSVSLNLWCVRLMWKTTPITIFFLLALMPWLDPPGVLSFKWDLSSSSAILISALLGFLLQWSGALALGATSATSHVVLGQFKTCVILLGSYFVFGSDPGFVSICGAVTALGGMSAYTSLNLQQQHDNKQQLPKHNLSIPPKPENSIVEDAAKSDVQISDVAV